MNKKKLIGIIAASVVVVLGVVLIPVVFKSKDSERDSQRFFKPKMRDMRDDMRGDRMRDDSRFTMKRDRMRDDSRFTMERDRMRESPVQEVVYDPHLTMHLLHVPPELAGGNHPMSRMREGTVNLDIRKDYKGRSGGDMSDDERHLLMHRLDVSGDLAGGHGHDVLARHGGFDDQTMYEGGNLLESIGVYQPADRHMMMHRLDTPPLLSGGYKTGVEVRKGLFDEGRSMRYHENTPLPSPLITHRLHVPPQLSGSLHPMSRMREGGVNPNIRRDYKGHGGDMRHDERHLLMHRLDSPAAMAGGHGHDVQVRHSGFDDQTIYYEGNLFESIGWRQPTDRHRIMHELKVPEIFGGGYAMPVHVREGY